RTARGARFARGARRMRRPAIVAALALGCAHRPIEPPPAVDWPAGKEFDAYLAADERRALSIDQPGGGLRVTCGITGEGSYARVASARAGHGGPAGHRRGRESAPECAAAGRK